MAVRGFVLGSAAVAAVLGVAALGAAAAGAGPLAPSPPPSEVTEPKEMIARSLQATLDADAVHLEASLSGRMPGGLLDRPESSIRLDGTTASADIRPHDAKTRAQVLSEALGVQLDAVTAWDSVWVRTTPDQPWMKLSLGAASAGAGVDINPLTLVDRLRAYLKPATVVPALTDVPCAAPSGRCHEILLSLGTEPAEIIAAMLPPDQAANLPAMSTTMLLDTDVATLRPAHLALHVRSDDGTVDTTLTVDASRWDDDIVIEEPSPGS